MKMKFGAIVVDGRGKIGGHVASKNRGGAYLRTKVTPSNGQTNAQQAVRNLFTSLTQGWRELLQVQRDAWNAAVLDYSRTDIFGDIRNPSGINLFQRLNNVLLSVGAAQLSTPPLPSEVPTIVATSLIATVVLPSMSLIFNPAVPPDTALKVFATAPMSAGKSYVKSAFRAIAVFQNPQISPVNLLSSYVAKFGNTGAIGQKIFVKIQPVNTNTGQVGSASQVEVITSA